MINFTRRDFIKASAAGIGMLAASGCENTVHKFIPYVNPPKYPPPGEWIEYATVCRECPAGCGMRMRHIDGRVTKAEGNPLHPLNQGTLCARGQSSVQGLYNPDRVIKVLKDCRSSNPLEASWDQAYNEIAGKIRNNNGKVFLLSNLQTGALAEVMNSFTSSFSNSELLFYAPFNYEALRSAHDKVFGLPVVPEYDFTNCDLILSIGADFLETWISPVEYTLRFSKMHTLNNGKIGKMIYIGPRLSLTASNSDEFIKIAPDDLHLTAFAILKEILNRKPGILNSSVINEYINSFSDGKKAAVPSEVISRICDSILNSASPVVLAGSACPSGKLAEAAAIASALINYATGSINKTVKFNSPHSLSNTATANQVNNFFQSITKNDVLIIHEANPVYSYNGAVESIKKAGLFVYIGTMLNETAKYAGWFLPADYPLETWGDYSPYPNIHGLMQPTMSRLYNTSSPGDILLNIAKKAGKILKPADSNQEVNNFYEWLQNRWFVLNKKIAPAQSFEEFWNQSLENGGCYEENVQPSVNIPVKFETPDIKQANQSNNQAIQLWLWPHIMLFDGSLANRPWMQEVPEPVSYLTWGSWIDINPKTAENFQIGNGDVIELSNNKGIVEAPARLTEDIYPGVVSLAFGQGHTVFGRYADKRGTNAFILLGSQIDNDLFPFVKMKKTGNTAELIYASDTQDQYGRHIIQQIKLSELMQMKPGDGEKLVIPLSEGYNPEKDIYPAHKYKEHRWAMTIDLQACIGCGACSAACYAENNIPFVGDKEVANGRELAWLKVIPYRFEDNKNKTGWLPLLCQQCDAAPCEPVCPVFASVHNEEGLNAQVYNRCIGTRYCSNNCPYKVRRFNWFDYKLPEPLQIQLNPEVTKRSRGVMEKCTFCVQRIRNTKYHAKTENRQIKDGEIIPACAQTCPAKAIVFGDLLDPDSQVTQITRMHPRRYHVLEELNTKPAVTYLKKIEIDKMENT